MYRILICDDEKDIVKALKIYLQNEEYEFVEAYDGYEAVGVVQSQEIQLVLMDIMMPNMDGIEAMRQIRSFCNVPVILLTAKGEDIDKIMGLNAGADDYITKPFNPLEVCARVKSQLRRYMVLGSSGPASKTLKIGGIEMDDKGRIVYLDGDQINLTPIEYDMLKLFMENPGRIFSPGDIYQQVWKDAPIGSEGTVAVHIRHLREKIEINPAEPRYVKVVWGQGYRMEAGGNA